LKTLLFSRTREGTVLTSEIYRYSQAPAQEKHLTDEFECKFPKNDSMKKWMNLAQHSFNPSNRWYKKS